ncbi:MAG: hypothetical protein LIO86_07395 [Lachnospiraceae bacterium]|nr:hypothetical protein [Lachnospiraceae bacterium]
MILVDKIADDHIALCLQAVHGDFKTGYAAFSVISLTGTTAKKKEGNGFVMSKVICVQGAGGTLYCNVTI